jgi:hypothetical protein
VQPRFRLNGEVFLFQLRQNQYCIVRFNAMQALEARVYEQPTHGQIDELGNTASGLMNQRQCLTTDTRVARPPPSGELVRDVLAGFSGHERSYPTACQDELLHLPAVRRAQRVPQLFLPDEQEMHQRQMLRRQVAQQTQVIKGAWRQILCIVDDQKGSLPSLSLPYEFRQQRWQQLGFGECAGANAKGERHQSQQVVASEPRIRQLSDNKVIGAKPRGEVVDESGLSCPRRTRYDNENLLPPHGTCGGLNRPSVAVMQEGR